MKKILRKYSLSHKTAQEFRKLEENNEYVNKRLQFLTTKLALSQTQFPVSEGEFLMTQSLYSLCGNN